MKICFICAKRSGLKFEQSLEQFRHLAKEALHDIVWSRQKRRLWWRMRTIWLKGLRRLSYENVKKSYCKNATMPLDASRPEILSSSFFYSDFDSETVLSGNSVPILVLRLPMSRTRFRFRASTGLELNYDSGSETARAQNLIPRQIQVLTQESWHFGSDSRYFHVKKGFIWVKRALLE